MSHENHPREEFDLISASGSFNGYHRLNRGGVSNPYEKYCCVHGSHGIEYIMLGLPGNYKTTSIGQLAVKITMYRFARN